MSTDTQPTIDPALAAHLAELAEIAREVGAESILLLRQPRNARLELELPADQTVIERIEADLQQAGEIPVRLNISTTIQMPNAGTILVIRFPAGDGGEMPVESL